MSCLHVTRLWRHSVRLINKRQSLHDSHYLTIGSYVNVRSSRYETRRKFREYEGCIILCILHISQLTAKIFVIIITGMVIRAQIISNWLRKTWQNSLIPSGQYKDCDIITFLRRKDSSHITLIFVYTW